MRSEARTVRSPDGLDLAVDLAGPEGAPVVVAVHGYPDDRTVWDAVVPLLADTFRVVTYDVRGAGASQAPADRAGYRIERLVADLVAVLDAVAPGRPVHLLAHDWGSIQGWQAVTDPALAGRFASFTSISGPCLAHIGAFMRGARLRDRRRQLRRSWYVGFLRLPVLPELAWRSGIAGSAIARREGIARPATRDAVRGLELYRANLGQAGGERRTDVPVQVLAPSGDRYVTLALQGSAERFAADFRFRRVAGGHWLPRSRPDVVARCVRELVDAVTAPADAPTPRRTRPTPERWTDRVVLVTGAGSGIGRAVARGFARRGAVVVAVDKELSTARQTAFETGGHAYQADVADPDAMAMLADRVCAEVGVPDVVVNNAGIAVSGPFLAHEPADWRAIVDVNLMGVVHGCRLFAARMRERGEGGHLVNVASAAAFTPTTFLPAYCATKSAVLMLSECLRAELAGDDIGVTALCPGFLPTEIGASARFVGVDDATAADRRRSTDRLLRRRRYPLDRVADAVVAAVEADRPIQLLTVESRTAYALSKVAPAALRRIARLPVPAP
jgi:NAD(P)-dependent dehydrogenase (short-subunit alcohol dehydrogenase family)/pimeloyl-ACP methyl ester carboxylesterase